MIGLPQNQDLGNGARPRTALGQHGPLWRLGALVSLPYSIGKVMLVPTPDGSLSLKPTRLHAPQGNRFQPVWFRSSRPEFALQRGRPQAFQNTHTPPQRILMKRRPGTVPPAWPRCQIATSSV